MNILDEAKKICYNNPDVVEKNVIEPADVFLLAKILLQKMNNTINIQIAKDSIKIAIKQIKNH